LCFHCYRFADYDNIETSRHMSERRSRGRPRKPEVDQNILSAARELLARQGYDAMTFEAISQMTGITRPTIYRRWPTRAHLANEIANGGGTGLPDVIGEQSLRTQVRLLIQEVLDQYDRPETGAANIGLIIAYQKDKTLRAELHSELEEATRAELRAIVREGQAIGKIRPDANADVLFDAVVGSILFRVMFSSKAMCEDYPEALTDLLCAGLAIPPSEKG
jgi:AcrR family transcriptional regulator